METKLVDCVLDIFLRSSHNGIYLLINTSIRAGKKVGYADLAARLNWKKYDRIFAVLQRQQVQMIIALLTMERTVKLSRISSTRRTGKKAA